MKPPFDRPAPLAAEATAFYEDERAAFNAVLERAYPELGVDDARWVIDQGVVFIPAVYLRYLLPALVEVAAVIAAAEPVTLELEQLARIVIAAAPLEPLAPIARGLRAVLHALPVRGLPMSSYLDVPAPLGAGYPSGHGDARLLALVMELEGESSGTLELLASEAPSVQMTVLKMSRGVLEGGWQLKNARAAALWALEPTIARLEVMKRSADAMVALAARFVLGEVERSSMPSCGDPECRAHAAQTARQPGGNRSCK